MATVGPCGVVAGDQTGSRAHGDARPARPANTHGSSAHTRVLISVADPVGRAVLGEGFTFTSVQLGPLGTAGTGCHRPVALPPKLQTRWVSVLAPRRPPASDAGQEILSTQRFEIRV